MTRPPPPAAATATWAVCARAGRAAGAAWAPQVVPARAAGPAPEHPGPRCPPPPARLPGLRPRSSPGPRGGGSGRPRVRPAARAGPRRRRAAAVPGALARAARPERREMAPRLHPAAGAASPSSGPDPARSAAEASRSLLRPGRGAGGEGRPPRLGETPPPRAALSGTGSRAAGGGAAGELTCAAAGRLLRRGARASVPAAPGFRGPVGRLRAGGRGPPACACAVRQVPAAPGQAAAPPRAPQPGSPGARPLPPRGGRGRSLCPGAVAAHRSVVTCLVHMLFALHLWHLLYYLACWKVSIRKFREKAARMRILGGDFLIRSCLSEGGRFTFRYLRSTAVQSLGLGGRIPPKSSKQIIVKSTKFSFSLCGFQPLGPHGLMAIPL